MIHIADNIIENINLQFNWNILSFNRVLKHVILLDNMFCLSRSLHNNKIQRKLRKQKMFFHRGLISLPIDVRSRFLLRLGCIFLKVFLYIITPTHTFFWKFPAHSHAGAVPYIYIHIYERKTFFASLLIRVLTAL
jgi:hypothetical protein